MDAAVGTCGAQRALLSVGLMNWCYWLGCKAAALRLGVYLVPAALVQVCEPTWLGFCPTHRVPRSDRGEQPSSPNLLRAGRHGSETAVDLGQDEGFGGRVRSALLAGFEVVGARSTFLRFFDW